jgi:hypothetical protein
MISIIDRARASKGGKNNGLVRSAFAFGRITLVRVGGWRREVPASEVGPGPAVSAAELPVWAARMLRLAMGEVLWVWVGGRHRLRSLMPQAWAACSLLVAAEGAEMLAQVPVGCCNQPDRQDSRATPADKDTARPMAALPALRRQETVRLRRNSHPRPHSRSPHRAARVASTLA